MLEYSSIVSYLSEVLCSKKYPKENGSDHTIQIKLTVFLPLGLSSDKTDLFSLNPNNTLAKTHEF